MFGLNPTHLSESYKIICTLGNEQASEDGIGKKRYKTTAARKGYRLKP
jgi:hypothetical protein